MLNTLRCLMTIGLMAVGMACPLRFAIAAAPEITDRSELLFVYDAATDAGRFEDALRYAVAGCERLQVVYLCREVADLPLQMAGQGIVVPPQYGAQLRRVASVVCLSGRRLINGDGVDVTGFVCGYYAQQYARSHGSPRRDTFLSRAWQYLDSIHDPAYAERLFQVACQREPMGRCTAAALRAGAAANGATTIGSRR